MSIPRDLIRDNPSLGAWNILTCYRGSITHGTYRPNSDEFSTDDKDVLALCVPPIEYYLGLSQFSKRGTKEIVRDEWDIVVYEARKAIRLLAQGNPNVLNILWLNENHYINVPPAGQLLLDNRDLFVSKLAYPRFVGYARSQAKKMEHNACLGYMGRKRKQLVERFGYDTKNSSHLIRLLRMGIEFLTDGKLYVERHDAAELLAIKRGEWTLEQVKAEADRLFDLADKAYIQSTLPAEPDRVAINGLCVNIVTMALRLDKCNCELVRF